LKDTESKVRGIELGVDDFLVKPVNKEILSARVKALLKKKEYFDRLTFEYEKALHSAVTDKLTGLYNHGYFKQFLKLEIERSLRQRHALTLMMLDIDDFKYYNDTLGHLAGDKILHELGLVIHQTVRKIDMAARYGGEEFTVVLPYTSTKGAIVVAERLRQTVETYPFSYKTSLPLKTLTISIGIASFQSDVKTIEKLIERSDIALYKAKEEGKNRVRVFDNV
jgi:two-component system, cell cycle response regulator